jgi:tRNA wybutosine-synthesizing protein 1
MTLPLLGQQSSQVRPEQQSVLEKQGYRMAGHHSAVKVCGWTKNMISGRGGCYKFTFYGIRSHQCMQMTTSMFCANRCTFCWRGEKAPVSKDWYGPVDEPEEIISESVKRHIDLLMGFKGKDGVANLIKEQMQDVRHVALSLTGEPITYPLMNEILKQFHAKRISTFLVTNGQYPEHIKKLDNVTQLYISVDAPNRELLKEIDKPLFADYYERMLASLDVMKEKTFRTTVRLTVIKGVNDTDLEGYKELLYRGKPDFIEVKGYMHVGASQLVLKRENMPLHPEVVAFAQELGGVLDEYEMVDEHVPSRVVLFVRKGMKEKRFIDFPQFFEIVNEGGIADSEDYGSVRMCVNG